MLKCYNVEMLTIKKALFPLTLLILVFSMNPADSAGVSIPKAEYVIAVIDASSPSAVVANLFYAFSSENPPPQPSRFTFWDLSQDNITGVKVSDYLFFEARYISVWEKDFEDDDEARYYTGRQKEQLEALSIYFFQQPFWSAHLAFRLPTSLLEWQLRLRKKYTGHDVWPPAFSSVDYQVSDEIKTENIVLPKKSGFNISYHLPKVSEKLTTRGVMFEYRESTGRGKSSLDIIEKILNTAVHYAGTGERLRFPVCRFYLKSNPDNDGVFLESYADNQVDAESLVHRINAHEMSSIFSQSGLLIDGKIYQGMAVYRNPPTDNLPVRVKVIQSAKPGFFSPPATVPDRIGMASRAARFLIIGLIAWIIFFFICHRGILRGMRLSKSILIALSAYFIYLFVTTIFSFMYGFGFLLGIIGMESFIRRTRRDIVIPGWRLIAYGLITSILTAVLVYFVGV